MPILHVNAGRFKAKLDLEDSGNTLRLKFRYNKVLVKEVGAMAGARWDPKDKCWSVTNRERNWIHLRILQGADPFARYYIPLLHSDNKRSEIMPHQDEMIRTALTYHQVMWACEMGTGKTLAAIETMEQSKSRDWWWIGPKSALLAVRYEFNKWHASVRPSVFCTYEGLKKILELGGKSAPDGVVFDESSKIKTETTQRSEAALFLSEKMRQEHKDPYIICMTGTPAPKDPSDWWHQIEVVAPGFLREGSQKKLKKRMCLVEMKESMVGMFPSMVTWWDDENKCGTCGRLPVQHMGFEHKYTKSINEVAALAVRCKGVVIVKMLKDVAPDLPDKIYTEVRLDIAPATLRAAKLIAGTAPRVITALIRLRQLSDGFQIRDTKESILCQLCWGKTETCEACDGTGLSDVATKELVKVKTPKDDALRDLLEEHESCGRVVIYAGFTHSIDRIKTLCEEQMWDVIRVDGRGWDGPDLAEFQDGDKSRKLAFVGNPKAGGMGLTLTASPSIIFWSNDHDGEARMQAEARIYRIGSKGARIIDLLHLGSDEVVLNNIRKKKKLQAISLGELQGAL